jgi:8-oxo-dGTP diphosphatase
MDTEIAKIYGNKVRVRASGLCRKDDKILLIRHSGLNSAVFWAPPGGGVDFGMSIEETIQKEFLEETNLVINVGPFAFGVEFINPPLHAIELFYNVAITSGHLATGRDPEHNIIEEAKFLTEAEILALLPSNIHGIFQHYATSNGLRTLNGFYKI